MKKFSFLILSVLYTLICFGQKTEINLSLNSGLFSFAGRSSEPNSFINYNTMRQSGYTNNPYGSKNGLSYGLSAQLQRITKKRFIIGLETGYETLRSKVLINKVSGYTENSTFTYDATGRTYLAFSSINSFPFIGHRFISKKLSYDILGGLEVGAYLKSREKGSASTLDGTKYTTSVDRTTVKSDIRPRIQLLAHYKKMGTYVGYSYGLVNYMSGYKSGAYNYTNSMILRFGITYRLN